MQDIVKSYEELCKKVGDLFFVRESLVGQLRDLDAKLTACKQERDRLQAKLKSEAKDAVEAPRAD